MFNRAYTLLSALALLVAASGPLRAQELHGLDPARRVTQYPLERWTSDDGLPQNSVRVAAQTQDGYLWIGTQEGLARFDGLEYRVFDKANSELGTNSITALYPARDGSLWIGTREGGVSRYHRGRLTAVFTARQVPGTVSVIEGDSAGNVWIGSYGGGLRRAGGGRLTPVKGLGTEHVSALHVDAGGGLWIGTRDRGVIHYDGGRVRRYTEAEGLPSNVVTAVRRDRDGRLWVGTREDGLARLENGRVTRYDTTSGLPGGGIYTLLEDAAGSLWIGTDGGLARFRDGRFEALTTRQGLAHDHVRALFQDREGGLWVGTDGGGLNRLHDGKFTTYTTEEGLAHDAVYTVSETAAGELWIGTEGGGVSRLRNGSFTTYTKRDGLAGDDVLSVHAARDGSVWIGTYENGLSRFADGRFTTYSTEDGLPSRRVHALFEDRAGRLWVGTTSGLAHFENGRFTALTKEHGLTSSFVTALAEDPAGHLLVGTFDGGLNVMRGGRVVRTYTKQDSLGSNFILSIHVDGEGTVWFATRESGLNRLKDGRLTVYTTKDGLFNDSIMQILEDGAGSLWMSSNRGLFRVSKEDLARFADGKASAIHSTVYDRTDGLESHEFNGGTQPAGWRGRDGRLWFASTRGVVSVDPAGLRAGAEGPPVFIERMLANGEPVALDGEVRLAPGARRFEFDFVGLDFSAPARVGYRYLLQGYDEDWRELSPRREAAYTNLAPGRYTFLVRAVNGDGAWSGRPATVEFVLEPFFYQTPLFYLLCGLLVFLAAFSLHHGRLRHMRRRQMELEEIVDERTRNLREERDRTEEALREAEFQKERAEEAKGIVEAQAEKLREMDGIKTRFFNNISHEFRTPLTLNIGPLENALMGAYGPVSDELSRQHEIMLRNSRRLLRLINQLLDLAKLESGKMSIRVIHRDVVQLLEGIVLSFTAFAEKRRIQLDFQAPEPEMMLFYDPECLEKVYFNLLSNAVKFTPEGGRIVVAAGRTTMETADGPREAVEVRVRDTGPGIPEDQLAFIFDRFHQVDGTVAHVQEGTGIGLSLVKELVELHGGLIHVESEVGAGTEFVVTIPTGNAHFGPNVQYAGGSGDHAPTVARGPMVEMAVMDYENEAEQPLASSSPTAASRQLILVVDDSPDIRSYMVSCLRDDYAVVTARDGVEALEKLADFQPEMVLSDVMMPRMDGFELCRSIKSDERWAHIPVILLTAKAGVDAKIEGLEAGADDYMAKPFNAAELRARVRNVLKLREHQTMLVKLNDELNLINQALRDASDAKTQILSIAAHDLKNPLNAIREFAKLILEDLGQDAPVAEYLRLIYTASDGMLHQISQLLDSAALESGKIVLNRRPVSLHAVAETVVRLNEGQAARKGQRILFDADDPERCVVEADADWMKETMDNLVNNALKYSPLQTEVRVLVRQVDGVVRFEVRDQGPGLTEEDKKHLFKKFQRLSALPTAGESSTGLGLSIVKQIVDLHGGQVWVESELGQGAAFSFELPGIQEPVEA